MAGGQPERVTFTYLPEVRRAGSESELTLRRHDFPAGISMPEGGWFLLAADVAIAPGGTRSKLYVWTAASDVLQAAVRAWLQGQTAPCPELSA
jgi:hypothetical protein